MCAFVVFSPSMYLFQSVGGTGILLSGLHVLKSQDLSVLLTSVLGIESLYMFMQFSYHLTEMWWFLCCVLVYAQLHIEMVWRTNALISIKVPCYFQEFTGQRNVHIVFLSYLMFLGRISLLLQLGYKFTKSLTHLSKRLGKTDVRDLCNNVLTMSHLLFKNNLNILVINQMSCKLFWLHLENSECFVIRSFFTVNDL